MNSKERVHATLKRETTDRVPIFMWFHPETASSLAKFLDVPICHIDEVMFNDIRQVWVGNNFAMEGITHDNDGESHLDFWNIEWVKEGPFNQISKYPLKDVDKDIILEYEFPYSHIDELLDNMKPIVALGNEYFIGCDISPCLFEMYCRLRGMEDGIMDLAIEPVIVAKMLEKAGSFALHLAEAACNRFSLGWLWTGDDVGAQHSMIMSPECWREMIAPRLAEIFKVGKSRELWVTYHSCGAIRPIIPDLIKMGLDVLNPIQCNCPGMDPIELKKEFGNDLAFMGGVDTQDLLPNGTVAQVQREINRLLNGMSGGGYILAASHTIPPETPLDNIFAMYEVAGISRDMILDRASDLRQKS